MLALSVICPYYRQASTDMTMHCAYTYETLLAYTETEHARWRDWFALHPAALDVPFAEGRMATVRGVVIHIFGVELRYAERLHDRAVSSYEDIYDLAGSTVDSIFAVGGRARALLKAYLAHATEEQMKTVLTFQTLTAGVVTASKHKIASNTFIHAIRHWAQIATVLRQAGFTDQWGHDVLLSHLD